MLLLGPLAFLGALAYRRYNEEQNSDLIKVKSRKASKMAAKHMLMRRYNYNKATPKLFTKRYPAVCMVTSAISSTFRQLTLTGRILRAY